MIYVNGCVHVCVRGKKTCLEDERFISGKQAVDSLWQPCFCVTRLRSVFVHSSVLSLSLNEGYSHRRVALRSPWAVCGCEMWINEWVFTHTKERTASRT